VKYKVIETSYPGNAVEGLESELNKLSSDGWRVVVATAVREIEGEDKLSAPVSVVVLERAD